jgi:phosphoribosyl-AMP cyclohydrolase
MRLGGGVWICEPPKPRNTRRQLEDAPIVDFVDHPGPVVGFHYIGADTAEIEGSARRGPRPARRRETRMIDPLAPKTGVFPAPDEAGDREEGLAFQPKFGPDGLATCVTVDASRGDVLMVAHMNEAALRATLATGVLHYWSRSRGALWRKGETSGQTQTLVELRVDCDQDAFLALVEVGGDGGACHTGRRSCFYRRVETDRGATRLAFIEPQTTRS